MMDNKPFTKKNNINLFVYDEIDFFEIYKTIARKWKLLAGGTLLGISVALVNIVITKPLYEGEFRIVLEGNDSQSISALIDQNPAIEAGANAIALPPKNSIETEIEVLFSSSVLKPVFEFLKSEKNSEKFNNVLFKDWTDKAIVVEPKRKTTVLTVKFRDTEKSLIYPITKLISETYQKYSNEGRQMEYDNLINYLENQIKIYKPLAQESALKATEFAYANNLSAQDGLPISKGTSLQVGQSNILSALLRENPLSPDNRNSGGVVGGSIETFRSKINQHINTLESQLEQAKSGDRSNIHLFSSLPRSNSIDSSIARLSFFESEIVEKTTRFKSNDPILQDLKRRRDALIAFLNKQLIFMIEGELKLARTKLSSLEISPKVLSKHKELTQKSLSDAYYLSDFENKLEFFKLEKARAPLPWRLISDITVNENPVSPIKWRDLTIGLLSGLFVGALTALGFERKTNLVFREKELIRTFGKEPIYKFPISKKDEWDESLNLIKKSYLTKSTNLGLVPVGKIDDDLVKYVHEKFQKLIDPKNIILDRDLNNTIKCDVEFLLIQKGVNTRFELENLLKRLELQGNANVEWLLLYEEY